MNYKTIILAAIAGFFLVSCASKLTVKEFYAQWKKSSPQERGLLVKSDGEKLILVKGKTRKEVIGLLGYPDNFSEVRRDKSCQFFMYRCGNMDTHARWTMMIHFNENGKADKMSMDN